MRAEGEAQAAELIGDVMSKNTGFLELHRLEAARNFVQELTTSGNNVMLDSATLLLDSYYCLRSLNLNGGEVLIGMLETAGRARDMMKEPM